MSEKRNVTVPVGGALGGSLGCASVARAGFDIALMIAPGVASPDESSSRA